jgi:hypothetical protein
VTALSDAEVLACADLQLPAAQDQRLSELLNRQQEGSLPEPDQAELDALMQLHYQGQLRKAQGLAEAVRRGLRTLS